MADLSADDFEQMCTELSSKLVNTLFGYPKPVAVCVIPGVMAAIAKTFEIPRSAFIAMFDSAMEDMAEEADG